MICDMMSKSFQGKELDVDEIQKKKEQYRLELRKQIDEAEALKKKLF